jgi:4-amino-4-deoxy-L-arabinose transferase-like glycosyltransferase
MDRMPSDEDGKRALLKDAGAVSFRRIWNRHSVSLMVLAALIVRMAVVIYEFREQAAPSIDHAEFGWEMGWVARSIFLGHGFSSPFLPSTGPTALVPPLFPYLAASMFRLFGLYTAKAAFAILSINSLFSALTCIPIYLSARYALGERVAMLAGWGWAIYPYSIYFSAARVWDYALTGLLFTTCFYFAQRLHQTRPLAWVGFGLVYGVAALANPSVLTMFPVFLLLAVLEMRRSDTRWLPRCAVAVVGLVAVLTPWTIHNYRALHFVWPVRDNFWLECWAGNNGDTFESNAVWAHPASNPLEMQRYQEIGETGYIAEKKTLAMNFIEQNPAFFVGLSLRRAISYWSGFWSFSPAYLSHEPLEIPDVFFCTGITVLMLLGARRFWRRDQVSALPYVLLIAIFPVTYYFTHATPDYRQPIEPEVVVLVVMGILSLKRMATPVVLLAETMEEESQLAMSMSTVGILEVG